MAPKIPKYDPVPKRDSNSKSDPAPNVQFVKDINGNISTHIPTYIRGLSYEILPIYYRINKSINTNVDMKYYIVWGFDIDKQNYTVLNHYDTKELAFDAIHENYKQYEGKEDKTDNRISGVSIFKFFNNNWRTSGWEKKQKINYGDFRTVEEANHRLIMKKKEIFEQLI